MTLSPEEVEHIARLARLSLSEAEKELYRSQLSSILDHVARLQNLDTQNIPPTFSVLPLESVARTDEPVGYLPSAGGHHDCVIVPRTNDELRHSRSTTL